MPEQTSTFSQSVQNVQPQVTSGFQSVNQGSFGKNSYGNFFVRVWQKARYVLWQIWPFIQRLVNFIVYTVIKVVKAIVRIGLTQTGLMKE